MKLLVVSDLHYSLPQYDWLAQNASRYDLVVIAGDLMELGSAVDPEVQSTVVEQYFRRICRGTPMVVCSGNHDLLADHEGSRSAEWLEDLAIPGLVVDRGTYECEGLRLLSLPWWESEADKTRAEAWLASQERPGDVRPVFWVHHAPPRGSRTSWNGRRDLGDTTLLEWIGRWHPNLVLSGHIHNAPYYRPEGSWIDRVGETVVVNGGRQTGGVPATIEIRVEDGRLTWCGMEGCEDETLAGYLAR